MLKELQVYEEYVGVSVLAPKRGARVPQATEREAVSHAHDLLIVPGHIPKDAFDSAIEAHIEHFDGATAEANPPEKAATVEHHISDEVKTPVTPRGSGLDALRGDTTTLSQELGNNLPLLRCRYDDEGRLDARGLSDYLQEWCAHIRLGKDEDLSTKGLQRWKPMRNGRDFLDEHEKWSRFKVVAKQVRGVLDQEEHRGRIQKAVRSAENLARVIEDTHPSEVAGARTGPSGASQEIGEECSGPCSEAIGTPPVTSEKDESPFTFTEPETTTSPFTFTEPEAEATESEATGGPHATEQESPSGKFTFTDGSEDTDSEVVEPSRTVIESSESRGPLSAL